MINNRQNGRRRGRGGNGAPRPNGGGPDRGNRIDNRSRGNASQLHEKYKTLARDAQMQGDRVTAEYYLQFADHYFRVLSEGRARFEEQRPARNEADGYDDEGEGDEGEDRFDDAPYERAPQPQRREERADAQDDRGNRQDDRGNRPDDRGNRPDDRGNRQADRGTRREEQGERPRPRDDREGRDMRGNREGRDNRERAPRYVREQPAVQETAVIGADGAPELAFDAPREPQPDVAHAAELAAPQRRPRTRRPLGNDAPAEDRIEAASLPPSLTNDAAPVEVDDQADAEAPKRRRVRKPRADVANVEA